MDTGWSFQDGAFRHTDGSVVTLVGRAGYRYTDSHGEYFADGEMLMGNPDAVVLVDHIFKLQDGTRLREMPHRRRTIAVRIKEALASQGYVVEIA